MNSLKSGFVVAVMLAAGYGAYVMLVKPPPMPLSDASIEADWSKAQVELEASHPGNVDKLAVAETKPASTPSVPQIQLSPDSPESVGSSSALPHNILPAIATPAPSAVADVADSGVTVEAIGSPTGAQEHSNDAGIPEYTDTANAYATNNTSPHSGTAGAPPLVSADSDSSAVENDPGANEFDSVAQGEIPNSWENEAFENDWRTAESQLALGQTADALFALSMWYENPDLSKEQSDRLVERLDQLADSVIYSTQHALQPSYEVRADETLTSISQHFRIPWQFLANVNGVSGPDAVTPGQQLKVVPGPFRCEIDLDRRNLTVFLGRYYAGRFPIEFGQDPFPDPGEYDVIDKTYEGRDFVGTNGQLVTAGDPQNPYGKTILQLTNGLLLHVQQPSQQNPRPGCIMLSEQDLADLFAILSIQSRVVVKASTPTRSNSSDSSPAGFSFVAPDTAR